MKRFYQSNYFLFFFLFAFSLGALLPLAFAPLNFWPIAIFSPMLLLALWQDKRISRYQAFWLGWSYGLGMFGVGVSWVFVSIHRFGNTDVPMAIFITGLLIAFLALFPAIQGLFLKRFFKGSSLQFLLLGFPSLWVLFEWLRSIAFTGFPWLFLGYTQLQTPLSGYGPIFSVYGISFAVALTSGLLVALFQFRKIPHIKKYFGGLLFCLLFIWLLGFGLTKVQWTKPFDRIYTVSLVQANISPLQKFGQKDPILATEQTYGALTKPFLGRDLILWPESAIPVPLPYSQSYVDSLDALMQEHHSALITGIQTVNSKREYYNSMIIVGEGKGLYHKHHLLPYGDYLPFESVLRGLISFFDLPMSSFSRGEKYQEVLKAKNLEINPEICYEIAFPELLRDTLGNSEVIVTLSEDGWFGDSFGPHQHLQIAQMRALEVGRPILRATTSGITAIIDHQGKITASIPQFQALVLDSNFQPMQGKTPWMIIGIWPLLVVLLSLFLLPGRITSHFT